MLADIFIRLSLNLLTMAHGWERELVDGCKGTLTSCLKSQNCAARVPYHLSFMRAKLTLEFVQNHTNVPILKNRPKRCPQDLYEGRKGEKGIGKKD